MRNACLEATPNPPVNEIIASQMPDLSYTVEELISFAKEMDMHFYVYKHDRTEMAIHYLAGLVQVDRANMERMHETVPAVDYQSIQQFISDSPWDHEAVLRSIGDRADELLGGQPDSTLIIAPSAFAKKGHASVGVARQWNGQIGKEDNCQVGVFAALNSGRHASLVDFELYLPAEWADDPDRCRKAKVPDEKINFRSKPDIALDLVRRQRELGRGYRWVQADADFGSFKFCGSLAEAGEMFLVDIPKSRKILPPSMDLPDSADDIDAEDLQRVEEYADALDEDVGEIVTVRSSEKGELKVVAHARGVWVRDAHHKKLRNWWLLVIRRPGERTPKYAFSNAPEDISLQELVYQHGQRHWIERNFQDAKGEVGMADYQVRGLPAWNHHMALCCMAMLFLMQVRMTHDGDVPYMSYADIARWLRPFLPSRVETTDDLRQQMARRHRQRASAEASARRNNNDPPKNKLKLTK